MNYKEEKFKQDVSDGLEWFIYSGASPEEIENFFGIDVALAIGKQVQALQTSGELIQCWHDPI